MHYKKKEKTYERKERIGKMHQTSTVFTYLILYFFNTIVSEKIKTRQFLIYVNYTLFSSHIREIFDIVLVKYRI